MISADYDKISMDREIRFNRYLPIAVIYFFFNSFLLPNGLLYTTLLTPLFLIWVSKFQSFKYLIVFFLLTIPFVVVHFVNKVEIEYYIRSYFLFFSVYVFGLCFYQFLNICRSLKFLYRDIVVINFVLTIVALIALFIPSLREILWYKANISGGIEGISRLRLFTYEPSYYSTLLVPVLIYFFLTALLFKRSKIWWVVITIFFSVALSFSFGVISTVALALAILLLLNAKKFFLKPNAAIYTLVIIIIVITLAVILLFLFPENIVIKRFNNVLVGRDTSFKGRTYDALFLGWKVAEMKSIWFGSGLGQTKFLGLELWEKYYTYNFSLNEIAVSNVIGDTLAVFGLLGVFIRISLQFFFFFWTKVYTNFYRFALFIFIFIYQFTGSFLFNIAEYVIWILAFVNVFREFDKPLVKKLSP